VAVPLLEAPGVLDPGHELIGLAGHGRDHHGASVPGVDLALHVRGDVADAFDVGDRRSAKFEHQQGHLPLQDMADREVATGLTAKALPAPGPARKRFYILTGGLPRNLATPSLAILDSGLRATVNALWPQPPRPPPPRQRRSTARRSPASRG